MCLCLRGVDGDLCGHFDSDLWVSMCARGAYIWESTYSLSSSQLQTRIKNRNSTEFNSIQFDFHFQLNWKSKPAHAHKQSARKPIHGISRFWVFRLNSSSILLFFSLNFFPHFFLSLDCCCCCMWFLRLRALFICLFVWILQFLSYSSSVAIVDSHKASWTAWMGQLMVKQQKKHGEKVRSWEKRRNRVLQRQQTKK